LYFWKLIWRLVFAKLTVLVWNLFFPGTAMQYFIKRNEKVNGPFDEPQIKSGVKSGKLKDSDLISNSKNGPWQTVQDALPFGASTSINLAPVEPATPEKGGVGDEEIDVWLGSASKAPIPAQNQAEELTEQIVVANTPELSHQNIPQRQTKDCPFCAEPIAVAAIKCKHCGEMLDGNSTTLPVTQPASAPAFAGPTASTVTSSPPMCS
jgi:hypothetical protein